MADLKDAIDNAPDDDNEDDEDIAKAKYTPPDGGPAPTDDSKAVMDRLLSGGQPQNGGAIDTSKWPKHQPAATPQGQLSDTEHNAIGKAFGTAPGQPTTTPPPQATGPVGPPATAKDDGHLTPNAGTPEAEAFRQKLMGIESHGGRYDDVNPDSGAAGAYQFVPSVWDKWMEKNFGHDVDSMVVKPGDDAATVAAKKQQQDDVYKKYYETELAPWVAKTQASGKGDGYNDYQLGYLFHREGQTNAEKFLKTGVAKGDTEPGNVPIRSLLAKMGATPDPNAPRGPAGDGSKPTGGKFDLTDNIKDASPTAKHDVMSLQQIMENMNGLQDGHDRFADELDKLRGDLKEQKSKIAQRELIDTIADALTKIGAGAYGAKTHVDMTHFETKPHDYQKDQEIAQGEFRANLDDLKSQREDDLHRRSAAAEVAYHQQDLGLKQDELGQRTKHESDQLALEKSNAAAKLAADQHTAAFQDKELVLRDATEKLAQNREDRVAQQAVTKAWQEKNAAVGKEVISTINSQAFKDDPERTGAGLQVLLKTQYPELDTKDIHDAIFKPHWYGFGTTSRYPSDMSDRVNGLLQQVSNPLQMVTLTNDKNQSIKIPRANLAEALKDDPTWQVRQR